MINHYNPIIGQMFILYLFFSVATTPCFIAYAIYKILNKIKTRKVNKSNGKVCNDSK